MISITFPIFFLTKCYTGQRWYFRWIRHIQVTYILIESVRLGDQLNGEVDKKGVHGDSNDDVRSLTSRAIVGQDQENDSTFHSDPVESEVFEGQPSTEAQQAITLP